LELARQCQYRACTGMALTILAEIHVGGGDARTARVLAGEALTIHRQVGHRLGEDRALDVFESL
jgi:hypothetical protein